MKDSLAAIIGSSMFAKAIAVELLRNGASVLIVDDTCPSSSISLHFEEEGVLSSYTCPCTSDWSNLCDATYIVTCQTGDELLLSMVKLSANVVDGQLLVMFPGYFMTEQVANILQRAGTVNFGICEMTSAPLVCSMSQDGIIHIHKRKKKLKYAGYKGNSYSKALSRLKDFLPMLSIAADTVETSLENINSILHPLPILLNLVAVQRAPENFRHFFDGIDEHVSRLMHLMDEERCAVGRSLGFSLEPTLVQLKSYYGDNDAKTIFEYIHTPECPYSEISGFGLSSRYIKLDVPYLVANTSRLAHANNVPVPLFDTCMTLARPFLSKVN